MTTILDQIVVNKRQELAAARQARSLEALQGALEGCEPPRDFTTAVTAESPRGPNVIAELKKRSPSVGLLVPDFDPVAIARVYHRHGAAAISVLTDETYFGGRLEFIAAVKAAVELPVLRKEFILDEYQLYESRVAGADAVLLIAEVLQAQGIADLLPVCSRLALTPLVEVHTEANLTRVLDTLGPPNPDRYLLGINNRDLTAQRTDLTTTARLAAQLPPGIPFISESGITTRADVLAVQRAGARAVLVGETLLRAGDIGARLDELCVRV